MICVLYALEEEIALLSSELRNRETLPHAWAHITRGTLGTHQLCLIKSGAGKVLSAMTAQALIKEFQPRIIILCGVSGALNPIYERGDLVIGRDFIQHDITTEFFGFEPGQVPFTDYKIIPATDSLLVAASTLTLPDARVHCGRILSGDQFISGKRGGELRAQFDGDVVDMESAAIAFVCHLNKVPFVIGRTISDKADDTAAHDFGAFLAQASRHVTLFVEHVLGQI